jgi:hypothetical protein
VTVFFAILGLVVAAVATWIAYLALVVSRGAQQDARHERDRADAHERLRWIEALLEHLRRLQDAQASSRAEEFRDLQMAMRASLAIGGLRRQLPVTAILSERPFSEAAARGKPGWQPFLLTVEAVRDELFDAASAIGDSVSRGRH